MNWEYQNPTQSGRYVVQTKSDVLKTVHTLNVPYDKEKDRWGFKRQKFYRYLKQ